MSVLHNMYVAKVKAMQDAGWQWADHYPAAGITILVRGEQVVTVMKNGKLKTGAQLGEHRVELGFGHGRRARERRPSRMLPGPARQTFSWGDPGTILAPSWD